MISKSKVIERFVNASSHYLSSLALSLFGKDLSSFMKKGKILTSFQEL